MPRALPLAPGLLGLGAAGACSARSRMPSICLRIIRNTPKPMNGIRQPRLVDRPRSNSERQKAARSIREWLDDKRPGRGEVSGLHVLQERTGGPNVHRSRGPGGGFGLDRLSAHELGIAVRDQSVRLLGDAHLEASARMCRQDVPDSHMGEGPIDLARARPIHVERVVAVPAGPAVTHLRQPWPDDLRWRCDVDAARLDGGGIRDEVVAGQLSIVIGAAAPAVPPREHDSPDEDGAAHDAGGQNQELAHVMPPRLRADGVGRRPIEEQQAQDHGDVDGNWRRPPIRWGAARETARSRAVMQLPMPARPGATTRNRRRSGRPPGRTRCRAAATARPQ